MTQLKGKLRLIVQETQGYFMRKYTNRTFHDSVNVACFAGHTLSTSHLVLRQRRLLHLVSSRWEDLSEKKKKRILDRQRKSAKNILYPSCSSEHELLTRSSPEKMRLSKRVALSGAASRREAEAYILSGRITVGGEIVKDVSTDVSPDADIRVDGKPLAGVEALRIYLVHKLRGELVTRSDPAGRSTLIQRLRTMQLPSNIIPVGRLDYLTEGLILFVNNGDVARALEHPSNSVRRTYRVRVYGTVKESILDRLRRGLLVDNIRYRPIHAVVESRKGPESWLTLTLTEGKNREIKRALGHLGLVVTRLIRTEYGPYTLGNIPKGGALEVKVKRELKSIVAQDS